jgi:hypothetical protein
MGRMEIDYEGLRGRSNPAPLGTFPMEAKQEKLDAGQCRFGFPLI